MRETTKSSAKVKANGFPSEIFLDISTKIKEKKKAESSPKRTSIAEERVLPEETNVLDQESPRYPAPVQGKNKKAKGFKVVGFREKSSRRSAKAFNRKPPEASKTGKSEGIKVIGLRKDNSKSRRRSQSQAKSPKTKESISNAPLEQVWSKEAEEKLEVPPGEVENQRDQPKRVQRDKTVVDPPITENDIIQRDQPKQVQWDKTVVDVGGDKQDKDKTLSVGGSEANTTFWERLTEFPEVLTEFPKQFMKRDKEETAFPKFVGHCVVDDIGDAFLVVTGDVGADDGSVTTTNEETEKISDIPKETKTKGVVPEGTKIDEGEANQEKDEVLVQSNTAKRLQSLAPVHSFENYEPTGEGEGSRMPCTEQQTQASYASSGNEGEATVQEQINIEEYIEIKLLGSNDSCLAF